MVKGNLLLESETFRLTDNELLLFVERVEALQLALVDYIDKFEYDTIYGTGDLARLQFKEFEFYQLGYIDISLIQNFIPNFSNDVQKTIIRLISHDDKNSVSLSSSFEEFNAEFNGENNGLLGLQCDRFACSSEFAVYNGESWYQWKTVYLTRYPQYIDWIDNHPYLPNLVYSNQKLGIECLRLFGQPDYKKFYSCAGVLAGSSKNALAIQVGKIIAESNFYQYDDRVSKLNNNKGQLRNIYALIKQERIIYLSIDVEKASFEVCDHTGCHIGEYWFDGNMHQGADKSGKHDIVV